MNLPALMLFLAYAGCVSAGGSCSYMALIESLGLNDTNAQMTSLRPVHNWTTPTIMYVDLYVSSITAVDEKAQSLSTQLTIVNGWTSDFTQWDPSDFCGMFICSIRKEMVWSPDINILESINTEFAIPEDPYFRLGFNGIIVRVSTFAVTSTCKMNLYNFPFDVQICTITLQSAVYEKSELTLLPYSNASFLTAVSQNSFQTQGEWDLVSINMTTSSAEIQGHTQDQLKYQVTMSRRPLLYVINLIVPVFYFLVLDVASFFMESGGEKLGFKVTLLLAISMLLLILNDILPSTTINMPVIGVYCTVIFTLIAVSILESIIVTFLKSKGEAATSKPSTSDAVKEPQEVSDAVVEKKDEISLTLELLKILREFQSSSRLQHQEQKRSCWTRLATIIDFTFFFLYLFTNIVFLALVYLAWFPS